MGKTVHIVFGNDVHRRNYARAMAVNPLHVIVATEPQKILSLVKEDVDTIKVIRFPVEVWKPTTDPCARRTRETEDMLKGFQRLGVTVVEVEK